MSIVQALVTGAMLGGMYAMMAVGLSVSWGMLRIINLAHFGMILLGAYFTFQLGRWWGVDPILSILVTAPLLFLLGVGLHWVYERAGLAEFTSLLVSFGVMIITIQVVHNVWSADFRALGPQVNPYGTQSWFLGPLVLPMPRLIAFGLGVAVIVGAWVLLRTTFTGRALRAFAEDRDMAAACGIDHGRLGMLLAGASGATAAIAGMLWALSFRLVPDAPFEWIGIVFAVVILGGIGQVLGTLVAGMLVGALASVTSLLWETTASLLVVFVAIVLALLLRPYGLFAGAWGVTLPGRGRLPRVAR
ncbi:MAG: branched-chain amino acid ABC transporter permease [Propionibacteriales bacterium]|nr:branched-chain amino acid ABC transporter permease [Propionibacteriales bacterium]